MSGRYTTVSIFLDETISTLLISFMLISFAVMRKEKSGYVFNLILLHLKSKPVFSFIVMLIEFEFSFLFRIAGRQNKYNPSSKDIVSIKIIIIIFAVFIFIAHLVQTAFIIILSI